MLFASLPSLAVKDIPRLPGRYQAQIFMSISLKAVVSGINLCFLNTFPHATDIHLMNPPLIK
jgi:hypothetical protein